MRTFFYRFDRLSTSSGSHRRKQSLLERSISTSVDLLINHNSIADDGLYSNRDSIARLTEEEKVETGSIPWSTYKAYVQAAGGYILSAFVLIIFIVNVVGTGQSSTFKIQ